MSKDKNILTESTSELVCQLRLQREFYSIFNLMKWVDQVLLTISQTAKFGWNPLEYVDGWPVAVYWLTFDLYFFVFGSVFPFSFFFFFFSLPTTNFSFPSLIRPRSFDSYLSIFTIPFLKGPTRSTQHISSNLSFISSRHINVTLIITLTIWYIITSALPDQQNRYTLELGNKKIKGLYI